MNVDAQRARKVFHTGNGVVALAASACLLGVLGLGFGAMPALGRALVPGHGTWRSAAGAMLPQSRTLRLAGLTGSARVSFSAQGVPSVSAQSQDDAYLALGYVQAEYRLSQMDVARRVAEGQLAELTGARGVASDAFELRLGLLRTAQQEWAQLPKAGPAARVLVAYSRGVNDLLAQLRVSGQWPAMFSLAGIYPRNWTPVDSLAVQGEISQELDFTTTPLDYALLYRSLGAARAGQWFPVLPPNSQNPYDPGPYRKLPLVPIPGVQTAALTAASLRTTAAGRLRSRSAAPPAQPAGISAGLAEAASAILAQARALPAGQLASAGASSAWAANGPKAAGGGAMLAGDPQLGQTLPSAWFEVALSAPGLGVSGVSVPGLPAILIGHNSAIAWSLTDTQSQAAMYYAERTSPARPGQYFWDGQWRQMRVLHYAIAVRGGPARQLSVPVTVHGPVLTQAGQAVSVDWMGALGSPDEAAMLAIDRAGDFSQFRAALAGWRSPALTFVYADHQGNIGAISAGYYPQVRDGDPWLPLPGNGADDVAGVIPAAAVPQVYDPPSHVIAAASQRPVGASYPYYLGTTVDAGYRADADYGYLRAHWSMRPASFAALQGDTSDQLAGLMVPKLLTALRGMKLTPLQQLARQALASWKGQMAVGSGAASIWWTFWTDYLSVVFRPWWTAAGVPTSVNAAGLAVGPGQFALDEDLQAWTLSDPRNAAFSRPADVKPDVAMGATPGESPAATMMRAAFVSAVSHLSQLLGGGPGRWQWARLHTREFPSLTQAAALGYGLSPASGGSLGYGPRSASGDMWTVDAAEGGVNSWIGPSWRMIVAWPAAGPPFAEGIYPGGQSENPGSPWYTDLVGDWWSGTGLPMPAAGTLEHSARTDSAIVWELRP